MADALLVLCVLLGSVIGACLLAGPPPNRYSWRHKYAPSPPLAWEQSSDGTQWWAFHGQQRFVLTHCYDPKKDDTEWELEYLPRPHGRITLRYFPTMIAAIAECAALASLVTPSRTDRQPPDSSTQAKGGLSAVAPGTPKPPDSVTTHEETP